MILWRDVKKAILNPLRTDLSQTRALAFLINNKQKSEFIDRELLHKLQSLLPSFPSINPEECEAMVAVL